MSMTLWWIGDAVLILAVFPLVAILLLRIIKPLMIGHRALLSISRSSRSITGSLPSGIAELNTTVRTAADLQPSDLTATRR
jgi:hypothetical protein